MIMSYCIKELGGIIFVSFRGLDLNFMMRGVVGDIEGIVCLGFLVIGI